MKITKEEDNKKLNFKAVAKMKKFSKEHQKGLYNGINIKKDAGNVEQNIQAFNNGFGNTGE